MAINALRTGLENYDKRHGWKGPIDYLGKEKNKIDFDKIKSRYKNIPGIHDREVAIVKKVSENQISFLNINSQTNFTLNDTQIFKEKWINNGKIKFDGIDGKFFFLNNVISRELNILEIQNLSNIVLIHLFLNKIQI